MKDFTFKGPGDGKTFSVNARYWYAGSDFLWKIIIVWRFSGKTFTEGSWIEKKGRTFQTVHQKLGSRWINNAGIKDGLRPIFNGFVGEDLYLAHFPHSARLATYHIKTHQFEPGNKIPKPAAARSAAKDISIRVPSYDKKRLFTTVSQPRHGRNLPSVLLIHGSGPETKDSGSGYEGRDPVTSPLRFFENIARDLSSKGVSVARYDKRGVDKSEGDWRITTRTQIVQDCIAVTKAIAKRNSHGVVLAGFSEGAQIAMEVAIALPKIVKGIIYGGGPAAPVDRVVLNKTRKKLRILGESSAKIRMEIARLRDVFTSIRRIGDQSPESLRKRLYGTQSMLWWYEHMNANPLSIAKKIQCPTLILHGEEDFEVLPEEGRALYRLLRGRKIPVSWKGFKGLNHFFAPSCRDFPGFEYDIPKPVPKGVTLTIEIWMKNNFDRFLSVSGS